MRSQEGWEGFKEVEIDKGIGKGGKKFEHSWDQSELLEPPRTPQMVSMS